VVTGTHVNDLYVVTVFILVRETVTSFGCYVVIQHGTEQEVKFESFVDCVNNMEAKVPTAMEARDCGCDPTW